MISDLLELETKSDAAPVSTTNPLVALQGIDFGGGGKPSSSNTNDFFNFWVISFIFFL